jgi:hypothetical protein
MKRVTSSIDHFIFHTEKGTTLPRVLFFSFSSSSFFVERLSSPLAAVLGLALFYKHFD